MQDLADVALGFRPDELVAPRLLDAIRQLGHTSLSFSDDGNVTHAVTHTPQPTHPSGFRTGWPRSSSASAASPIGQARARSEEHTSELQSRGHLVCRLLLEKKKHTDDHSL